MTVDGRLCAQSEIPTDPQRGPTAVLDDICRTIAGLGDSLRDLTAIGVACAGQIHADTGRVLYAANLGWRDVALGSTLASAFGVPVTLDNDVRAAAWGEFRFGVHRSVHSLLAVFVGTGIGSGAVLEGRLWHGAGNAAGELGHTQVVPEGLACPCGGRGCLEQYVSGRGFQRRLEAAMASGVKTILRDLTGGDPAMLEASMVAAAANSGDDFARRLWSEAVGTLTPAVANYVTLLNPQVLVLGGGLFEALPELFDAVSGGIVRATTELARACLSIERARLGGWAGVLGAAALASAAR